MPKFDQVASSKGDLSVITANFLIIPMGDSSFVDTTSCILRGLPDPSLITVLMFLHEEYSLVNTAFVQNSINWHETV